MVQDRIVGELLQPGGAMALERMGLEESIASTAINSVPIHGYVVVQACATCTALCVRVVR